MADITVTVTGNPPGGTYLCSPDPCPNGKIAVGPGTISIQFKRGSGQGWAFQKPYITFRVLVPTGPFAQLVPRGPFDIDSASDDQVTITDKDPGGGGSVDYEYTLHTNQGIFDPEIINH